MNPPNFGARKVTLFSGINSGAVRSRCLSFCFVCLSFNLPVATLQCHKVQCGFPKKRVGVHLVVVLQKFLQLEFLFKPGVLEVGGIMKYFVTQALQLFSFGGRFLWMDEIKIKRNSD